MLVRSSMDTKDPDKAFSEATTYIEFDGSPIRNDSLAHLPLTWVSTKGTCHVYKIALSPCSVIELLIRNGSYRVAGVTSVGETCIWTCEYAPHR